MIQEFQNTDIPQLKKAFKELFPLNKSNLFYRLNLSSKSVFTVEELDGVTNSDNLYKVTEVVDFDNELIPFLYQKVDFKKGEFNVLKEVIENPLWGEIISKHPEIKKATKKEVEYYCLLDFGKAWLASDILKIEQPGALLETFFSSLPESVDADEFLELPCPNSADPSQRSILQLANSDKSFFVEGPPGSGKSQTISNMIYHAMLSGKRVLVLSSKYTSLKLLKSRLSTIIPSLSYFDSTKRVGTAGLMKLYRNNYEVLMSGGKLDQTFNIYEKKVRYARAYTEMAELMSEANFSSSTYIDLALPDILNNRKDIEEVLSWDCTQILKRTTIPINKTERFTEIVRLLSDYLEKRPTWKVSQWVGFSVKLQSFRDLSNRELARIFNPKSKASRRLKNLIKMYVSGKDLTQTISYSLLKDLEPINNTNGIRRFVWKRRLSKLLDVPSSNVNESVWLEAFNESKLKKESEEARLALIDEFTIFHPEADYNYIKAVQQEVSEEDKEFIKDISSTPELAELFLEFSSLLSELFIADIGIHQIQSKFTYNIDGIEAWNRLAERNKLMLLQLQQASEKGLDFHELLGAAIATRYNLDLALVSNEQNTKIDLENIENRIDYEGVLQSQLKERFKLDWDLLSEKQRRSFFKWLEKKRPRKTIAQLRKELSDFGLNQLSQVDFSLPNQVPNFEDREGVYDLLIVDEAGQIPFSYALPALQRSKKIVAFGDSKQMTPNFYFGTGKSENSLMEVMLLHFQSKHLKYHYRSNQSRLFEFANKEFYKNEQQITSPGESELSPIVFHDCRGVMKEGVNTKEAELILLEVEKIPNKWSIGIISMNKGQQLAIEKELQRSNLKSKVRFNLNLESVQGEEADVVLISTVYSPDEEGKQSLRFGPLNQQGGESRINVLSTRAKEQMQIFSSIDIQQLISDKPGIIALKRFLEFAKF